MRIDAAKLARYTATAPPAPPPVEPRLTAEAEAAVLASRKRKDPAYEERLARVRVLLHRAATPTGTDAELIALLAAKGALPIETAEDRLRARQRLTGIGALHDPPPAVRTLARKHGVKPGDGVAFADALIGRPGSSGEPHNGDNVHAAVKYGLGGV